MSWEGEWPLGVTVPINVLFVDAGAPVLGAAAVISIYNPALALVINGVAMTELGLGVYYYNYVGSATAGIYKVRCAIIASNLYAGGTFTVIDLGTIS